MGDDRNRFVSKGGVEEWPDLSKDEVAEQIAGNMPSKG